MNGGQRKKYKNINRHWKYDQKSIYNYQKTQHKIQATQKLTIVVTYDFKMLKVNSEWQEKNYNP